MSKWSEFSTFTGEPVLSKGGFTAGGFSGGGLSGSGFSGSGLSGGADGVTMYSNTSSKFMGFSYWYLGLALVVAVVIIVFIGTTKTRSLGGRVLGHAPRSGPTELHVVQSTVTQEPADATRSTDAPTVRPKTTVLKIWNQDSGPTVQPFFEQSGFSEFQNALEKGRERPVVDTVVHQDVQLLKQQLEPFRKSLKGQSLEQFVESNNMQVPESLLEIWNEKPTNNVMSRDNLGLSKPDDVSDSEALMLAQEAVQIVPTKGSPEVIINVLREILAARTEASHLGITLPFMPEQKESIKFWTNSSHSAAAAIAKSILSRI